jgi:hypothetical protein
MGQDSLERNQSLYNPGSGGQAEFTGGFQEPGATLAEASAN